MLANFQLFGVYAEADKALHLRTIERVTPMVRHYAPAAPPAQRKVVATVISPPTSGAVRGSPRATAEASLRRGSVAPR